MLSHSSVLDSLQLHGLSPARLLCPWDFSDKNIGVGCHSLLQEIFLTQVSEPRLLHWQVDSLPLSHLGSLKAPIGTGISDRLQNLPSLHDPKKQMIFLSPGIKAENQSVTGLGITSMRLTQKGA